MNGILILGWIFLIAGICCWMNVMYCLVKLFKARLLLEMPLTQQSKNFKVVKKGGYAIWQEGPLFKLAPMAFIHPEIMNTDSQQMVKLKASIGRPHKNGFTRGSNLMFYCELQVGNYCLEALNGSSLSPIEDKISQAMVDHLSIKKQSDSLYNIQIRESLTKKQRIIMLLCIFAGLFLLMKGLFTIISLSLGTPMEGSMG
jgi:hypothetical protein